LGRNTESTRLPGSRVLPQQAHFGGRFSRVDSCLKIVKVIV